MKKWPEKNKIVHVEKLLGPIKKIVKEYFKQTKKVTEDIKYNGYDIGFREQPSCLSPNQALTKKNLDYALEDQGHDLMDYLLLLSFQLGIEQSRRITANSTEYQLFKLKLDNAVDWITSISEYDPFIPQKIKEKKWQKQFRKMKNNGLIINDAEGQLPRANRVQTADDEKSRIV